MEINQNINESTFQYSKLFFFAKLLFPFRKIVAVLARHLIRYRGIRINLVFGMSRSGTTFLSHLLSLDNISVKYIHEPIRYILKKQYIRDGELFDKDDFWGMVLDPKIIDWKVHLLALVVIYETLTAKKSVKSICIKPLSLIDGIEEACLSCCATAILIVRHPCGRTESILRQPKSKYEGRHATIEDLISLGEEWGRTHSAIESKLNRHREWILMKHEDLSMDPIAEARELYNKVNLRWTPEVESKLRSMTTTDRHDYYGTTRNSKEEIEKWRSSMTPAQIEAVRLGTIRHITSFYEGF